MYGKLSLKWAWSGHVNDLNFGGQQLFFRNVKFCTHVNCIKWMSNHP